MVASAYPSQAMEPHVRVIHGYQAGCTDCHDSGGNVWLGSQETGTWVGWAGEFCLTWIAAKLEAIVHNIEKHPRPQPSWEEIIHGRQDADVVHSLRTH